MLGKYFKIHGGKHWTENVFFRVNHPIFPTLLFGSLATVFVITAMKHFAFPWWGLLLGLGGGLLLWTLIEYCLHRFVFHWTQVSEPWRTLFSGLHMSHHRDPKDPGLIIAPPTLALVDSVLIFLILWGLTWNWGIALILMAGIDLGYIFYEWVHFGVHEFKWNHGLFGYYKRYHFYHHFQQPKELYGVTCPLWDSVFKTST